MPFVYSLIFHFNQKKVVDEECLCKCSTVYKIPKGHCTNSPPSLIDGNLRHSIQKGVCLQQFLKENECLLALPTGSYIYIYIYIKKMDCKRILSGLVCTILDWGPNRGGLYG
jgi:hypothetical protein